MNLRDLEYLVAVAELGHFGRAAEACHVSQPTLSMQLKKLEDRLSVVLVERSSRHGAKITPVGQEITEKAREMLQLQKELSVIAGRHKNPLGGPLHLGAFPTLAPYLFPLISRKIAAQFPKLELFLVEEKTAALLEQLANGQLDAALIALPVEQPGIVAMPLFQEPFFLAVPEAHPLAQQNMVWMEELGAYPILLLDEGHCLRDQALSLCHRVGAKESSNFRATSLETLRQMVVSGGAITLIPQLAARPEPGIRYIPFKDQTVARQIALCTRSAFPRVALVTKLAGLIQAETTLYMAHGKPHPPSPQQ